MHDPVTTLWPESAMRLTGASITYRSAGEVCVVQDATTREKYTVGQQEMPLAIVETGAARSAHETPPNIAYHHMLG